jgi:hypothetical protein
VREGERELRTSSIPPELDPECVEDPEDALFMVRRESTTEEAEETEETDTVRRVLE